MPRRPDFTLRISLRNIEDFSPDGIVKSPRTFRPQDVQNACRNVALAAEKEVPPTVMALAHYVAIDFFALAHATGLYNRQIKLWEGLSKTQSIETQQMSKGLFSKEKLPEFDILFLDHKKRNIAAAHFAAPSESGGNFDYMKATREFLKRVSAYTGVTGIFLCFPSPFPEKVLDFVRKETNANDSIARYESLVPKLGIPINLLEMDHSPVFHPGEQTQTQKIRLIHPDLGKKKNTPGIPAADMSQLDSPDIDR